MVKVPVQRTPSTRVGAALEGYSRGGTPLDFTPITRAILGFAQELEAEKGKLEEWDLQRRFIQETNELISDFDQRKQSAPLGASGFTQQTLADYETRHTALLDEYWEKGYSEEALRNFSLRLGGLRQNFGEQALVFQTDSTGRLADKEMSDFAVGLSQYATTNPDGYASAIEELRTAVWNFPGLTEQQRETIFEGNKAVVRQGAAKALAIQNPQLVIDALDPQGFTAPIETQGAGAYQNVTGWQSVATNVASELGLNPVEVAAVMSFESAGTFDPTIMGGDNNNYMGLIQFGPEERRTYGITENSTPEQWTNAVLSFMRDRGFTPGMGIEDFYSTILTGRPGRYDATDSNGTSVRNAIPRILAEHVPNAEKWLASAIQTFDPGPSTAGQENTQVGPNQLRVSDGVPDEFNITDGKTNNPLLDDLNGAERLQVLGWAREQLNQQTATIKASMDVVIANAQASIATGEYAGPQLTREQVIQVYGPVEGEQKWAAFSGALQAGQVVQRIKTLNSAEIQREVEALRPDPASPTYAIDLQRYNAAQQAAAAISRQREADPAAYVYSAFPEIARAVNGATTSEQRRAAYAQVERAFERLGVPERLRTPMTKEMLENTARTYRGLAPEAKLDMLEEFISEMGGKSAGRTLALAGGSEIAQDLVLRAVIIGLPNYRSIFSEVVRGRAIIEKDPARKPAPAIINQTFAKEFTGAINNLNPDVSRSLNEAAAAIYVHRGGRTESGALSDPDLYVDALRQVVGGVSGNKNTGIVDMSTGKAKDWTVLPTGWTENQFRNWIESRQPGDLTKLNPNRRAPVDNRNRLIELQDIVDEGVFVMVAPGRYGIKMGSDGKWILEQGTGRPFIIHIEPKR